MESDWDILDKKFMARRGFELATSELRARNLEVTVANPVLANTLCCSYPFFIHCYTLPSVYPQRTFGPPKKRGDGWESCKYQDGSTFEV